MSCLSVSVREHGASERDFKDQTHTLIGTSISAH